MARALIVAGAACVHDDVQRALALFSPDAIIAVNNQICDWRGRVDYAVTLHPEPTNNWPGIVRAIQRRKQSHLPQTWAHKAAKGVDRHTPDWGGSSGLFAVKVALEEGFTRVVLAGVPMDAGSAHYFDPKQWAAAGGFRKAWLDRKQQIAPLVRSMSGWTRSELGEPTTRWLAG